MLRSALILCLTFGLSSCGLLPDSLTPGGSARSGVQSGLYPGETPEMRALVRKASAELDIPESLLHRVIQRESDYNAGARNGPYYGLMQILPETAAQMGHTGSASSLLDAETNLRYAGRYLRGAWIVSDGDEAEAVGWYARGYYYEARNRCLLVETGLRTREVKRSCRG